MSIVCVGLTPIYTYIELHELLSKIGATPKFVKARDRHLYKPIGIFLYIEVQPEKQERLKSVYRPQT